MDEYIAWLEGMIEKCREDKDLQREHWAPEVKTGREFHDWCRTNFYVKRQRLYLAVYTYLDKLGSYTEENDPRIILNVKELTAEQDPIEFMRSGMMSIIRM